MDSSENWIIPGSHQGGTLHFQEYVSKSEGTQPSSSSQPQPETAVCPELSLFFVLTNARLPKSEAGLEIAV